MMDAIELYMSEFSKLHVNRSSGKIAPHKAILLLSIIDLIESGHFSSSEIFLDNRLQEKYSELWHRYVGNAGNYKCSISYPFYHMEYESFWHLQKSEQYQNRKEFSSVSSIVKNFKYAVIDSELYCVMQDKENRARLRVVLITNYLTI